MKNHCSRCCKTPHPAIQIPHPQLQILKSLKTSKKSTKLLSRFSANESTQAVQETRNPAHWNAVTPGRGGNRQYTRKEMKQRSSRKGTLQHGYSAALHVPGKKRLQFILPIEGFMFFKPKFCSVLLTYVHFENNSAFAKNS